MQWIREQFKISDNQMDKVYIIPFKVMIHTKAKELLCGIVNKYLAMNSFLKKIVLTENDQCTFCEQNQKTCSIFSMITANTRNI